MYSICWHQWLILLGCGMVLISSILYMSVCLTRTCVSFFLAHGTVVKDYVCYCVSQLKVVL